MTTKIVSIMPFSIAILGALIAPTGILNLNKTNSESKFVDSYFKYTGIPGIEEDDVTKWDEISQSDYDDPIIIPCSGPLKGCKIKVSCTVIINGVKRPCCVTIILVGGKKTPIVATVCGTAEIINKTNN